MEQANLKPNFKGLPLILFRFNFKQDLTIYAGSFLLKLILKLKCFQSLL